MSHFYGSIEESARKTVPTACGDKRTGLTVKAASWRGAIEVRLSYDKETGLDKFKVEEVPHHGAGNYRVLAMGVLGAGKR